MSTETTTTTMPATSRVPDPDSDLRPHDHTNGTNGDGAPRVVAAEPLEPAASAGPAARLLIQGVIVLALLGLVAGGYYYFTHTSHAPAAGGPGAPGGTAPPPMPVGVIAVEPRDVPLTTEYLAQTEPSQIVPIRARVNGYLVGRDFEEGQRVTKGQTLFRIDPQPYQVALQQAQAGLAAAQAREQRSQQSADRYQGLAEVQSAAKNELETAQEEQKVAAAEVQTQQALIDTAELNLGYATIDSPIDGVIGQRQQDVGSYINGMAGDATLATVRQVDPMYVRFAVSEQDLLKWQRLEASGAVNMVKVPDLTVKVILGDKRVYAHEGKINYTDVAVDPSTGTAVTRATVPNPDGALLPGQYVNVVIGGVKRVGAIAVPQSAVLQTPGGTSVYVVGKDDKVESRPIVPGEWAGSDWIIESGLKAGDRVVVDHLMQLSQMPPGVKVNPVAPATRPVENVAGADASANPAAVEAAATKPAE